jgi:hypothetical protein
MTDNNIMSENTTSENTTSIKMVNNQQFMEYVSDIIKALGISDNTLKTDIESKMQELNTNTKLKIINNNQLQTQVENLLAADTKLHELVKNDGILNIFYKTPENKQQWDNTMAEVARLQGLIVLRKISETNCDGIIKTLLGAFDTKLKAVNDLLSADLKHKDQTGGDDIFKVKYEKYKMKYLTLKNKLH